MTSSTYDASDIKHLTGVQAVRAKPGMYIGETDGTGIFTILRELCDNFRDEALSGHCTLGEIYIDDDGSYWVLDNGRGMPVGDMKVNDSVSHKSYTMPALQAITSLLHAGGKLEQSGKAYAMSVGSHGVGQKATNFLSTEFDVWTFSAIKKGAEKSWYHIGYELGILKKPMSKCKAPDHPFRNSKVKSGTVIRMKPDLSIFSEKKFPMRMLSEWAQIASYFTDKLKITLCHHSGSEKTYYSPNGPAQYVTDKVLKLKVEPLSPKIFVYSDALVDCVFQLTSVEGCEVNAFTNGLNNPDKGNHFNSLFASLMGALEPYTKRGQEFGQQELRDGLVGLVNVKLSSPKFSSQKKEKLVDERAGKPLQEILSKAMKDFFSKNKSLATMLCERASELRKLKSKFSASKQVLNKLKQVTRIGLPAKAAVSPHCKPEHRELYLLEGESAASLARSALFPGFQELLPLKGKVSNALRKSEEQVLLDQEVVYALSMIGFNPNSPEPLSKLRVSKVIFMADPDPDGAHINSLLLALKYRYLPSLIDKGMIYVADTPEFFAETKAGYVFGDSTHDMKKKLKEIGHPNARINHVKGYGEFELAPLRELVFAPETRRLIQLQPLTKKDRQVFESIMGESVEGRKLLLGV